MSIECEFPNLKKGAACECGYRLKRDYAARPRRTCPARLTEHARPRTPSSTERPAADQLHILGICHECERCGNADPEAGLASRAVCQEVVDRGKAKGLKRAGRLMHRRGIPSTASRCPIGKWGPPASET